MPEGKNSIDRELTRSDLEQLIATGVIDEARRETVIARQRASISWRPWILLWTGVIGIAFLLSGVIFFFAWNWKELSPLARFGILEGSVALAIVGALVAGIRKPAGRALLLAASVLTGVLVAVYGQVYQTGADAFEVFALWAALIFGWVLVSRFAPLWLVWLAVLQTAVATWFGQVPVAAGQATWVTMYPVLGAISLAFAALREWLAGFGRFDWLRGEWLRLLLWFVCLAWLSLVPWDAIFEFRGRNYHQPLARDFGILLWIVAVAGGGFFHTRIRPSLTGVGFSVLAFAIIVVVWMGKAILDDLDEGAVGFLLAALIALGVFAGAAVLISKAAAWMPDDDRRNPDREGGAP